MNNAQRKAIDSASPRARTRARIKTLADAGLVVATWHGSAVEVRLS
jgi:hypothetical protein